MEFQTKEGMESSEAVLEPADPRYYTELDSCVRSRAKRSSSKRLRRVGFTSTARGF